MLKVLVTAVTFLSGGCFGPVKEIVNKPEAPIIRGWPTVLKIDSSVASSLYFLAEGLHHEFAVCGLGEIRGDTATVEHLVIPEVQFSNKDAVRSGDCPFNTVIRWHNHPYRDLPPGSVTAQDMCYLSTSDIRAALAARAPFVAVGVEGGVQCYWNQTQVRDGYRQTILMPVRGQTTYILQDETIDERIRKLDNAFGGAAK